MDKKSVCIVKHLNCKKEDGVEKFNEYGKEYLFEDMNVVIDFLSNYALLDDDVEKCKSGIEHQYNGIIKIYEDNEETQYFEFYFLNINKEVPKLSFDLT